MSTEKQTLAPRQKWLVMGAVSTGVFLATIDGSIVNIAVPTLQRELNASFALVQWVILSYLLTITTLLASFGRLGDMLGKKKIYTAGFAIFTGGSLLCALAGDVGWLIAARIVQAFGAAMMFALGPAIVTEAFPGSERGRALGIVGIAVSAGIVTGPILGGYLVELFSWHAIFLVNVPIGIAATWLVWQVVPDSPPRPDQRFDYLGATLLGATLLALLLALTFAQDSSLTAPLPLGLLIAAVVGLVAFIVVEQRTPQPIVDLRLFRNSEFSVSLITGLITFIAAAGTLFLLPFYLENVLGYTTGQAGQLLAIIPITLGLMSPLSGWLADRFGTRPITVVGLGIILLGFIGFEFLGTETTALLFIVLIAPIGLGMGVFQSPNNSAILGAVPPRNLGVASSLMAITRTLGQTIGIAALNAIWASRIISYSPEVAGGDITAASAAIQVAALRDTALVIIGLVIFALLLATWSWLQLRRDSVQQPREAPGT